MPFRDSSFDSLICGWTISYSQTPARLADEMRRVVKPRGIVVFGIEVAGPTSPLLPDVPHGADRIQTAGQLAELLPDFDVIA
jgi:ubiquinone/menaquinone biosynthesis C-methylase UbiE